MPDAITEGELHLVFAADWQALKFDNTAWYRGTAGDGVKAVDVVVCNTTGTAHWWLEIKDCLGFEGDNQPRLSPNPPESVGKTKTWAVDQGYGREVVVKRAKPFIVDEVADKVAGTLASLVGASRAPVDDHPDAAQVLPMAGVMQRGVRWSVVLLLAWSPAARDFGRLAMRLRDKLGQRLAAYQVECFVVNEGESAPNQPWTVTRTA